VFLLSCCVVTVPMLLSLLVCSCCYYYLVTKIIDSKNVIFNANNDLTKKHKQIHTSCEENQQTNCKISLLNPFSSLESNRSSIISA